MPRIHGFEARSGELAGRSAHDLPNSGGNQRRAAEQRPGPWNPGCRSPSLPFPTLLALASSQISCQLSINPLRKAALTSPGSKHFFAIAIAIVKHANDLHRILCWKLSRNKSKVDSVPIGRDKSTANISVTAAPGGPLSLEVWCSASAVPNAR
jgi:hypothetical protein